MYLPSALSHSHIYLIIQAQLLSPQNNARRLLKGSFLQESEHLSDFKVLD